MNLALWLEKSAKNNPDSIAIYDGFDIYATYGELFKKVKMLANGLRHEGIRKGDRVAIFSQNCPEYLEIFYSLWWIGAVVVPINYKLHENEVNWILENSNSNILFTNKILNSNLLGIKNIVINSNAWKNLFKHTKETNALNLSKNDLAWIFYTSGTTGRPKGAMLSHGNLMASSFAYCMDVDNVEQNYNMFYAAPMSHGAGIYHFNFIRNGSSHIIPKSRKFHEEEIKKISIHFKNIVMFAAPTMVNRIILYADECNWDGDGIRTIIYAGGPMYLSDINRALEKFGNKFVQVYGQAETPMTITCLNREQVADDTHKNWKKRRASVGQVMAGIDVKIANKNLEELNKNEVGEVLVYGDTVMKGYLNNEKATSNTLVDGWLRTGDLGYLDDDGFLNLTDRLKDVIISGGTNIYPREVEEVLLNHPSVKEVSVVSKKDNDWGEIVVAFIVLYQNKTLGTEELDKWCKENIASFKKPKIYKFIDKLPKNNYGKILKTTLKKSLV